MSATIIAVRLGPAEDLLESIAGLCRSKGIKAGYIITCAGSLHPAVIRLAGRTAASTLTGKWEIVCLSGTLSENGSHIHMAVADENGDLKGGHLMKGSLVHTTVELILGILPGTIFRRVFDSCTGYHELSIDMEDDRLADHSNQRGEP